MLQKYLSLEGYTVSNPGQRPGIAGGESEIAWRAIRPRRWRREPHLLALSPVQQKYLSQEGYTVSKSACHNGQSAALLSDSGLVMYFSTLPAPSSSAPCILTILTHLHPQATPGDSRWQGKISLEGYTPAKMAARAAASLPCSDPSLFPADSTLLRADLLLTARGTASLPPEGRQVYRPRDGKFTARGAVSNEF